MYYCTNDIEYIVRTWLSGSIGIQGTFKKWSDRCGRMQNATEKSNEMLLTRIGDRTGWVLETLIKRIDQVGGLSDLLMVEQKRKSDGISTVNFNHGWVGHKVMNDFRPLRLIFSIMIAVHNGTGPLISPTADFQDNGIKSWVHCFLFKRARISAVNFAWGNHYIFVGLLQM